MECLLRVSYTGLNHSKLKVLVSGRSWLAQQVVSRVVLELAVVKAEGIAREIVRAAVPS